MSDRPTHHPTNPPTRIPLRQRLDLRGVTRYQEILLLLGMYLYTYYVRMHMVSCPSKSYKPQSHGRKVAAPGGCASPDLAQRHRPRSRWADSGKPPVQRGKSGASPTRHHSKGKTKEPAADMPNGGGHDVARNISPGAKWPEWQGTILLEVVST